VEGLVHVIMREVVRQGLTQETAFLWLSLTGICGIPTAFLDVISLVASSCGYERGQIEQRAVHEFAVPVALQRGLTKRL